MSKPNYKLIKEAYAIIGGIPESQFNLDQVIVDSDESFYAEGKGKHCGTIACAAGWLGLHPKFQELGYKVDEHCEVTYKGVPSFFDDALGAIFNIEPNVAAKLFDQRSGWSETASEARLTDKEIWQKRIRSFLRQRGQLKSQLAAKRAAAK